MIRLTWRSALTTLATAWAVVFVVTVAWVVARNSGLINLTGGNQAPAAAIPTAPLMLEGLPIKGDKHAVVGIVMFSDFQCPFCRRFAQDTLPMLDNEYISTQRVFVAFHNFPLTAIHPLAKRAAEVASCAKKDDKFWAFHDRLFSVQGQLTEALILNAASESGLKGAEFVDCVRENKHPSLDAEIATGLTLTISGTPTFFLGYRAPDGLHALQRFDGTVPADTFRTALDALLKQSK
jgi:protein-disulfide isomerase